ncbi:ABC transporter ATP-binding protein [Marinicella litoralis]|uniref:ABC-2 type transport system ATP-binding protein n=1 Tax=Marinicella litoralis TaxID=644220 RepID=A0A4R6XVD3_9GAMM|nr:ABC transporter ATP-binding protein [Marinicella litoralis]TDR20418.1 ABC-2 type transport system ATP-binding protein [Marinicella litoralis]
MIKIQALSKSYGQMMAADDINFNVEAGEIFGLLGPNGAGKSTTINCISGLLKPSLGEVSINQHSVLSEPIHAKASLGLVPQDLALYEDLSGMENLNFWGQAYGLSGDHLKQRIETVLDQVGLTTRAKDLVNTYSGGMKRRLNFACAILHEPKALLLDEPTVGVDPQSREHLLSAVEQLKSQGTAVLYTTHYMEEAERLCDRIAIIDHGKIIATGTVNDLRSEMGEKDLITLTGDFSQADQSVIEGFELIEWKDHTVRFMAEDAAGKLSDILSRFEPGQIKQTAVQQANLESLFIKLTGRELRD